MKKASIFLTLKEVVRAICIDFEQYDPQIMLFAEVLRLISKDTIHLKREPEKPGAWINRIGDTTMHWMDGPELITFMCDTLSGATWNADLAATVSQRVFQSRSTPEVDTATGQVGIRIETNMEAYRCRQCGHCCHSLDYHHEVTDKDMSRWKALGRSDILEWVAVYPGGDAKPSYRIWVSPQTGRITEPCPFLKKDPASHRWQCRIHNLKPAICRQYPVSRKHANMTGCKGFDRPPPHKGST